MSEKRPVNFGFDESPTYEGLTDDSHWNGFLNVWITPAVRDQIVSDLEAEATRLGADRDDVVSGIDEIPVEDGLVSLAGGFATFEIQPDEDTAEMAEYFDSFRV